MTPGANPGSSSFDGVYPQPWRATAVALAAYVLAVLVVLMYPSIRPTAPAPSEWILRLADLIVISAPLVAGVVVAWMLAADRARWRRGIRDWRLVDLLLGVGVGLIVRTATELVQPTTGTLEGPLSAGSGAGRIAADTVLVVGLVVVSPIVEELFFRWLLLPAVAGGLSVIGRAIAGVTSVLVSTAAFVALHVLPYGAAVPLGVVVGVAGAGLGCGILILATGRIGGAIIAHVVFNASGVALLIL